MRGFQKKPFLMMESTPSLVNWDEENNVKKTGDELLIFNAGNCVRFE